MQVPCSLRLAALPASWSVPGSRAASRFSNSQLYNLPGLVGVSFNLCNHAPGLLSCHSKMARSETCGHHIFALAVCCHCLPLHICKVSSHTRFGFTFYEPNSTLPWLQEHVTRCTPPTTLSSFFPQARTQYLHDYPGQGKLARCGIYNCYPSHHPRPKLHKQS